ncbi:MAG: hypothetical protein CL927_03045 [Deltaproteobacteria bacterium]|nr:hypothetical protein [Deltaproteobacteria bacterium]
MSGGDALALPVWFWVETDDGMLMLGFAGSGDDGCDIAGNFFGTGGGDTAPYRDWFVQIGADSAAPGTNTIMTNAVESDQASVRLEDLEAGALVERGDNSGTLVVSSLAPGDTLAASRFEVTRTDGSTAEGAFEACYCPGLPSE